MTSNQGGGRASPTARNEAAQRYRQNRRPERFKEINVKELMGVNSRHVAKRKVREVVTGRGKRVRGYYPGHKGKLLKFESLIEEAVLRVLDSSSLVSALVTQPCVLTLGPPENELHYTPDMLAIIDGKDHYIEVKPDNFADRDENAARMRKVIQFMREEGMPLILILASDVYSSSLQEELKELLRLRSRPGRFDKDRDSTQWSQSPFGCTDSRLLERWRAAQQECDALIKRVMRRDPDSLIEQTDI